MKYMCCAYTCKVRIARNNDFILFRITEKFSSVHDFAVYILLERKWVGVDAVVGAFSDPSALHKHILLERTFPQRVTCVGADFKFKLAYAEFSQRA